MSSWAERVHRRAADLGSVVTSCGHPGTSTPAYPYRLEKVKFGVPLDEVCKSNDNIPGPLLVLILKLNKESPNRRDVFRAPGHQGAMKKLIHFLQTGRLVNVDNYSVFTIASVLKKFLRKIPNGIFGRAGEAELFTIIDLDNETEQAERLHKLFTSLPKYTQHLLVLLFGTFRVIASNAQHAGTGMTSEALGVSVAPSFFQSCVSDGKTARMEDVLKFKVATKIMKHIIDRFATQDIFGRENYEYYARVTGRILKVQDEWICNFQHPPPPRGKLAQQKYALQHSLEAEKTWLQCQCERWGLLAQEESRSTPALLTSSSSALDNSVLSLGVTPEHSFMESCARLSVSLEGPGLYAMTSSPLPKRADSIGGNSTARQLSRAPLSISNVTQDNDDETAADDEYETLGAELEGDDEADTEELQQTAQSVFNRSGDELDGAACSAGNPDDESMCLSQLPKKSLLRRSTKLRTIRSGNRNLLTVAAAQISYDDEEEEAVTVVKRRYRQHRKKNVSSSNVTATQMRMQQQQQRMQRELISPTPSDNKLKNFKPKTPTTQTAGVTATTTTTTAMRNCMNCQRGGRHATACVVSNNANKSVKTAIATTMMANDNNSSGSAMTLEELRAVNRYAESTKSLSYLPQVHERQTARMRTRSEWFLGPRDDADVTCSHAGVSADDFSCSLGNLGMSLRTPNCCIAAMQLQNQQQQQQNQQQQQQHLLHASKYMSCYAEFQQLNYYEQRQLEQQQQQQQQHHHHHNNITKYQCYLGGGSTHDMRLQCANCEQSIKNANKRAFYSFYEQPQLQQQQQQQIVNAGNNINDNGINDYDDDDNVAKTIVVQADANEFMETDEGQQQQQTYDAIISNNDNSQQQQNNIETTTTTKAAAAAARCRIFMDTNAGSYFAYNCTSNTTDTTTTTTSDISATNIYHNNNNFDYVHNNHNHHNNNNNYKNNKSSNNNNNNNNNHVDNCYTLSNRQHLIKYQQKTQQQQQQQQIYNTLNINSNNYNNNHSYQLYNYYNNNNAEQQLNLICNNCRRSSCISNCSCYINMRNAQSAIDFMHNTTLHQKHQKQQKQCFDQYEQHDDNELLDYVAIHIDSNASSDDYQADDDDETDVVVVAAAAAKQYYSTDCLQQQQQQHTQQQCHHLSMCNLLDTPTRQEDSQWRQRQLAAFASKSQPNLYSSSAIAAKAVAIVAPLNVTAEIQVNNVDNTVAATATATATVSAQDATDFVLTSRYRHSTPLAQRRSQRLRAADLRARRNANGSNHNASSSSSRAGNNLVTVIFNVLDFLF